MVLDRSDPHLELATVNENVAGLYSCKVTTSLGDTQQSPDYQLLAIG